MAINVLGKDNNKDIDYKEGIKTIKEILKEPEFNLNG
jgi:hypothetical protein